MTSRIPKKLFKFQSYDPNTSIKNLEDKKIYFPKKEKLNDPFDLSVPINFGNNPKEYQKVYERLKQWGMEPSGYYVKNGKINQKYISYIKRIYEEETLEKITKDNSKMGIACFSEMRKGFPNDVVMWSHYAEGHKGFCLEFDTSFQPFLQIQKIHKVIYCDSFPYSSPIVPLETGCFPIESLITKAKKWEYEHEWRLIIDQGDTSINYDPRALTSIYFGCLMPRDQIEQICSIIEKTTKLFKIKLAETEFKLELTNLP